jgi:hypothetical protein
MPPLIVPQGLHVPVLFILRKTPKQRNGITSQNVRVRDEIAQVVDCTGIYIRPLLWSQQGFCLSKALHQITPIYIQQDATLHSLFISGSRSTSTHH